MNTENLISVTSRISDAQELIARGFLHDAVALLNEAKIDLWHAVHQASAPALTFDEWLEKNKLFFSTGGPGFHISERQ